MADEGRKKTVAATTPGVFPKLFPRNKIPAHYLEYREAIKAASKKHDVPEAVLWGILQMESSGRRNVVGSDNMGQGPFQIDKEHHAKWLATHDPNDINQAADYAASIIAGGRKRLGNLKDAVTAYNAGEGGVLKARAAGVDPDRYTHTKDYSRRIMNYGGQIERLLPEDPAESSALPGPVTQEPQHWETTLRKYAPESAEAVPPVAGLGVSTNPLLMALESLKAAAPIASAKEKPLDVGGADIRGEYLDAGMTATPEPPPMQPTEQLVDRRANTIDNYFRIKSPEREAREAAGEPAPMQPTTTSLTYGPGGKLETTDSYFRIQSPRSEAKNKLDLTPMGVLMEFLRKPENK